MRKAVAAVVFVAASVLGLAAQAIPPPTPAPDEAKGFTAFEQFSGTVNSTGHVLKLDSSVGYNFNRHFGVDVGVPFYFAGLRDTATTQAVSNNGIGNPYLDLRLAFVNPVVNYRSVLTAFIPAADTSTGFSTGRVTFDWTNHFDHSFSRLTPFLNAGVANSIPDSQLFDRPFTSLGFTSHFEGGASLRLLPKVSIGASAYGILPSGDQKIYSKVAKQQASTSQQSGASMMGGSTQQGRVFEMGSRVTGTSDITRDHGFSAWFGVNPHPDLTMEIGYTRSVGYNLNSVAFNVGLNIGRMLKRSRQ